MKPVIHTSSENEKKPVRLELDEESGGVVLNAVNGNGRFIAYLLIFDGESVTAADGAFECLEGDGYDTNFTEWDEYGAMKVG